MTSRRVREKYTDKSRVIGFWVVYSVSQGSRYYHVQRACSPTVPCTSANSNLVSWHRAQNVAIRLTHTYHIPLGDGTLVVAIVGCYRYVPSPDTPAEKALDVVRL